jgi:hypothetical protein
MWVFCKDIYASIILCGKNLEATFMFIKDEIIE